MLTQLLGSFAEFERAMIRERTRSGRSTTSGA
jgi:DNA invertase Pin-like site-specific DNA recombinase